jgi:splicing factor 1
MSDGQSLEAIREEEINEKRELYKGVFKPLKQWYSSANVAIRNKYGELPLFWQDLETWSHTKALVKLFLTIEEKKQSGDDVDEVKLEEKLFSSVNDAQNSSENISEGQQAPKKRRNRWGEDESLSSSHDNNTIASKSNDTNAYAQECKPDPVPAENQTKVEEKKPKKSRFAPSADAAPVLSAAELAAKSQEIAQQTLILNMKMQHINERLATVAVDAARIEQDPNRDPSPPPRYDSNGKRTNTREIRMREDLMKERVKVIEELIRVNPSYIPPPDYVRQRPFRKLYIPVKEYPTYNFIGLIIGPRGNTQRSLESESGCKISIRGKGSAKNFGQVRKQTPDDDDELHVHIQGDTEANVEKGAALVSKILTPIDDENNEHKQKQLRELVS